MVADPQVQAREMFVELEHPTYGPVKITVTPLKLSETPARVERLAPLPGEHSDFCGVVRACTRRAGTLARGRRGLSAMADVLARAAHTQAEPWRQRRQQMGKTTL